MNIHIFMEITLNSSTEHQNESGATPENIVEIDGNQENKSGKSNSELMAEFFSVHSEADNK